MNLRLLQQCCCNESAEEGAYEHVPAWQGCSLLEDSDCVRPFNDIVEDTPIIATVQKSCASASVGLHLDLTPGAPIQIYDIVAGGPVAKYNDRTLSPHQIKPGSYLTAVNGIRGCPSNLIREICKAAVVSLEVYRPICWTVTVYKRTDDESLGLDLYYAAEGRSLVVGEVMKGAVARFNKGNNSTAVKKQDRITSVNGAVGDSAVLMEILSATNPVKLVLSRPSGIVP